MKPIAIITAGIALIALHYAATYCAAKSAKRRRIARKRALHKEALRELLNGVDCDVSWHL